MGWDNRIFNVNGRGVDMLESALALVMRQNDLPIRGSVVDPKCGLIWLWSDVLGASMYPADLTPRQAAEISIEWLKSAEAKSIPLEGWDENADHDGDNSCGWRCYVGDWGHVGRGGWQTVVAVKPVFLWHGK